MTGAGYVYSYIYKKTLSRTVLQYALKFFLVISVSEYIHMRRVTIVTWDIWARGEERT